MRWFRKKHEPPKKEVVRPTAASLVRAAPVPAAPIGPEWDVNVLIASIAGAAADLTTWPVDAELIEARLADCYRDSHRAPLRPAEFARCTAGLDESGWRRFAVAVWALEHGELRTVLAELPAPVERQIEQGFLPLARTTDALTLELIAGSVSRAEEFGRHFAAHLAVRIASESPEISAARRQMLDYRRLLAAAHEAKATAQEQMEYLRKLQEAQDARRRRGKW